VDDDDAFRALLRTTFEAVDVEVDEAAHAVAAQERIAAGRPDAIVMDVAMPGLDGDERPETSHLTRVDLKENGKGLKIVRQSLPYGTASGPHGLYFIAYCARLHNIEQQLLSMFGETDGKRDDMLRFTRPVTGGYYFAPSLDKLLNL